jgi:hypothetical protein
MIGAGARFARSDDRAAWLNRGETRMTSRGISNDEIRRRAQVRTDKADQRRVDALKSIKTQQTMRDAEQAKTLRLRALRLAREEVDARKSVAEDAAASKAPRKKKAASPAKV